VTEKSSSGRPSFYMGKNWLFSHGLGYSYIALWAFKVIRIIIAKLVATIIVMPAMG